ncbi:MAG: DUF2807 domain-containing protein [Bacteroidetes bacterium]|nr:DUF2807 domain-containing protein [Bacteroidota bacterium]
MRYWTLIGICLLFTTCKKGHEFDCFRSAGGIATETFDIGTFSKLSVNGKISLELVYSPNKTAIEITYNKNLLNGISRDIVEGELILKDENKCNWVRSYDLQPKIRLFYNHSLEYISVIGAAKVFNTDTLRLHKLIINNLSVEDVTLTIQDVNGIECNGFNSGGFIIKGQAGYMATTIDDASFIDIRNLELDDLYLFHYSIRSSHIKSQDIMEVKLYGKGDVYIDEIPTDTSRWRCCKVELEKFGSGEFK